MRIRIRRGLDIPITGSPEQRIEEGNRVEWVGLVVADYAPFRGQLEVAEGEMVKLGQPLLHAKAHPEIKLVSPGAGEVVSIHRGARRSLQTIVVRLEGDEEVDFTTHDRTALPHLDPEVVRTQLQRSGAWASFRTRPFGNIPIPASLPHAIFVTAIDTNPLAADPRVIIAERPQAFADGVAVLTRLTEGSVYVCQSPDAHFELPKIDTVQRVSFEGPHPAGLPGTHIHFLDPVTEYKTVWHLNYQEVIAIGSLFTEGRLDTRRVVALGGPVVRRPRLIATRIGASTEDLLAGELEEGECRVISGSILSGRRAAGHARYLGPHDVQISVLREDRERHFLDWLAPGFSKFSSINAFTSSLRTQRHRYPLTTSQHGSPRAMVPIGNFESVMPLDILPAPLLKSLIVRDTESARALGCLELAPEDLALCSFVCCSKYEYGAFLEDTLAQIEEEG